jgi:YbgC/YbaW family acyl-CoA thioester hydrolase
VIKIPAFEYRVAYCDTDAGGIVYHSRYFDIAERSRNEILHHFGQGLRSIEKEYGLRLVVSNAKAVYENAAFLDDVLTARQAIERCSAAMVIWKTSFNRGDIDISSVTVRLAAIGKDNRISIIPDQISEMFANIQTELSKLVEKTK